jgi:hypothetical protein
MGGPVEPSAAQRAGQIEGGARCAACLTVGTAAGKDPDHGWLCVDVAACRVRAEAQGLHLYPRRAR